MPDSKRTWGGDLRIDEVEDDQNTRPGRTAIHPFELPRQHAGDDGKACGRRISFLPHAEVGALLTEEMDQCAQDLLPNGGEIAS